MYFLLPALLIALVYDLLALTIWLLSFFHCGRSRPYSRQYLEHEFLDRHPEWVKYVDDEWARRHSNHWSMRDHPVAQRVRNGELQPGRPGRPEAQAPETSYYVEMTDMGVDASKEPNRRSSPAQKKAGSSDG